MGAGASSTPNAAAALTSTTLAAELRSLADAVEPVPLAEQTEAQGEVLAARLETLAANVRKSTASPKVARHCRETQPPLPNHTADDQQTPADFNGRPPEGIA